MRSGRSDTAAEPQATQSILESRSADPGAYQRRPGWPNRPPGARPDRSAYDQAHAERDAYLTWLRGRPASADHPYLVRKGVGSHGLRQDARGRLLLPARDATGWLGNVQTVDPDGTKLFPEGSRKVGLAVPIGPVQSRRPLLIAEGYATAATLYEATGLPALAAFDSGNLVPVAQAWRARFPSRRLVIAGDNDHQLPRRERPHPNVGRDKAAEAAAAIGGRAVLPDFPPDDLAVTGTTGWPSMGVTRCGRVSWERCRKPGPSGGRTGQSSGRRGLDERDARPLPLRCPRSRRVGPSPARRRRRGHGRLRRRAAGVPLPALPGLGAGPAGPLRDDEPLHS